MIFNYARKNDFYFSLSPRRPSAFIVNNKKKKILEVFQEKDYEH